MEVSTYGESNNITIQHNAHLQEHASQQVQNLREKACQWKANIKAKKENLDQKEEKLQQSHLKKETLTYEMSDIRKGIESAQSIEGLLQEKNELEQMLKQREEEVKTLKLKLCTMGEREQHLTITAKQQEAARYQRKLDSVKKKLKAERKRITALQEELQEKTAQLKEKSVEIQFLREARDSANFQLRMEKEKAELLSKQLTAAAISDAVHMTEVKVLYSDQGFI